MPDFLWRRNDFYTGSVDLAETPYLNMDLFATFPLTQGVCHGRLIGLPGCAGKIILFTDSNLIYRSGDGDSNQHLA